MIRVLTALHVIRFPACLRTTGLMCGFTLSPFFVTVDVKLVSYDLWDKQNALRFFIAFSSVQFSSVTRSCPTLCDPMNRSTPGLPVYQKLPESMQTHAHCVSDAIQPFHLLSSPSPSALNLSQHQGLVK